MSADVKPFQCQLCGSGYTVKTFLDTHMKEAHVEGGQYGCGECCCIFNQPNKLHEHQVMRHDYIENATISNVKRVSEPKEQQQSKEKSLKCKFCGITFHNYNFLKSHQKRKHGYESEDSEESDEEEEEEDNNDEMACNGNSQRDRIIAQKRDISRINGSEVSTIGGKRRELVEHQESHDNNERRKGEDKHNESQENIPPPTTTRSHRSFMDNTTKDTTHVTLEEKGKVGKDTSQSNDSSISRIEHATTADDDDDNYDNGPNDFEESHIDSYQSSFQLPMPTDFLVQNDYDVEPEEAQIRRANIEQLINSIPEDEESTVQSCDLCGTMYADLQSLLAHKKKNHVKGGSHKCQSCTCVFATGSELIVHNGIFHNTAPPLAAQIPITPEKLFLTCDLCGMHFDEELKLTIHKLQSHVTGGHVCSSCPCSFMSVQELTEHQQNCISFTTSSATSSQRKKESSIFQYSDRKSERTFINAQKVQNQKKVPDLHKAYPKTQEPTPKTYQKLTPKTQEHSRIPKLVMLGGNKKEFLCQMCGVSSTTYTNCTNHINTCHVPGGKFGCPICPCVFKNKTSLNSHKKRHSREAVSVPQHRSQQQQQQQQQSVSASSNVDSMQICSCEICGVNFLNMIDYLGHKQEAHVANGQFACNSCPCVFETSENLKTHRVVFHNNLTLTVATTSANTSAVVSTPPTTAPRSSSIQSNVNPGDVDISMLQPNSQGKYSCPLCGGIVANKNTLRNHLQKSHVANGYRCKLCTCCLSTMAGIKNHLHQYHRGVPNVSKQYSLPNDTDDVRGSLSKSSVNNSRRSSSYKASAPQELHDEDDEFKCAECDWTLSDATDLQNHKIQFHGFKPTTDYFPSVVDDIIHDDDPYSCSACHRTFKRKSETLSHRKRNHVAGGKFPCSSCKCVYSNEASLLAHEIAKHKKKVVKKPPPALIPIDSKQNDATEHVCILCGRKYQFYASLCAHKKRSHKPNGKAACTHCTCIFNGFTDLDMHFKKYHRHVNFAPEPEMFDSSKKRGRPKKNAPPAALRFACQYYKCGTACKNQSTLTAHIRKAHLGPVEVVTLEPDNGVLCEECNIEFDTKRDLAAHRHSVHDYDVIQNAIENPTMTSTGKYECRFCATIFARCSAMIAHVKTMHIEETRLVCFECPESDEFANLSELKLHRKRIHGVEPRPPRTTSSISTTPVIVSYSSLSGYEKPKQPQCELCGRVFFHRRSLWAHRKRSHVSGGALDCEHCSCSFGTSRGLHNHQLIFHGIRQVSEHDSNKDKQDNPWLIDCEDCDLTFTSCRKYEAHQKRCHVFGGDFACADCNCCFSTSSSMNVHKIKMHGLELPEYVPVEEEDDSYVPDLKKAKYSCSNCHLTFGFLRPLISHRKVGHGIEDKKCIICRAAFPSTDLLIDHAVKSHDSIESGQPIPVASSSPNEYPCSQCGMILSLESSLQVHMEVAHVRGGQFPCPLCPCIFGSAASLSSHKLGHNLRKTAQTRPSNMMAKPEYERVGVGESRKRGRPSKDLKPTVPNSTKNVAVAKKKTSYPPARASSRNADIVGMAFSAAMGSDSKVEPTKKTESKKRTRSRTLECKLCSRKFTLAATLQDHMKRKHGDRASESPSKTFVEQIDLDSDGGEDYFCTNKKAREATPPPPPPPPKKKKTKFPCKECNIVFPRKRISQTHRLICHVKTGTLKCDKCTCTFSLAWGLHYHKKYQHGETPKPLIKKKKKKKTTIIKKKSEQNSEKKVKKRRKAKFEKGFFSPRTLKNRERLINWTETMHPCKVCGMKFRLTSQLARHEKINHPGRPEYLCEKCPSMTALSKELIYHEEIYHSHFKNMRQVLAKRRKLISSTNNLVPTQTTTTTVTTVIKPKPIINFMPLKLDENLPLDLSNVIASYSCGSEFSGQNRRLKDSILRRKLRQRKGIYMCRVCRMMFLKKRSLSWHLKIHVGEKPFKCRFCSVTFRTYGNLCFHKKKHLAIKSGEKEVIERNPLGRCSYCKTTFRTSLLADIHFDEVHPELKFLDMCQEASNLWKEIQSGAK